MDTRTLLYSRLDTLSKGIKGTPAARDLEEARKQFMSILSREYDTEVLEDLFGYWQSKAPDNLDLSKLGDLAAVLLDPESEPDQALSKEDYQALSAIINDHADDMDIDQLTLLMNLFLSKGAL